jgi:hypothetical protein
MSPSERYIPPSAEGLERRYHTEEAAMQSEREREELLRAELQPMRKADLVDLALRVACGHRNRSVVKHRWLA